LDAVVIHLLAVKREARGVIGDGGRMVEGGAGRRDEERAGIICMWGGKGPTPTLA